MKYTADAMQAGKQITCTSCADLHKRNICVHKRWSASRAQDNAVNSGSMQQSECEAAWHRDVAVDGVPSGVLRVKCITAEAPRERIQAAGK